MREATARRATLTKEKEIISRALDRDDSNLAIYRSLHDLPPEDGWANHRTGSMYILIRVGPEEVDIENRIRAALGHPPETFRK